MSTEGVSYVAGDKMDVKLEMPIDLQLFVQTLLFAGSVLAGIVTAIPLGMAYVSISLINIVDLFKTLILLLGHRFPTHHV